MMQRALSIISHLALIGLAFLALVISTFVWLFEVSVLRLAKCRPADAYGRSSENSAESLRAQMQMAENTTAADD